MKVSLAMQGWFLRHRFICYLGEKETHMARNDIGKRRFKRYEVDYLNGSMLFSSAINILNISMDGAAITTTHQLATGREYTLKLRFEDTSLNLKGKVVWSVLSHSKTLKNGEVVPVYKAGIRFTNTLTDTAAQLISYIEKNRSNPFEQRAHGIRVKVNQTADVEIHHPYGYTIKKISLSGMLIETDSLSVLDTHHVMEIALDGTKVTVMGRIANQAEITVNGATTYHVGVEFMKISDDDMKVLQSYIDALVQQG